MIRRSFSLTARLGATGFVLSLGLIAIALAVDLIQGGLAFDMSSIEYVYANNSVQWIIMTSPIFLTSVFYFLGKSIRARELKIEHRAIYEHEQFQMLETFIGELQGGNFNAALPDSFSNQSLSQQLGAFRDKLTTDRSDEQKRIWEKEGLAQVGEVSRVRRSLEELSDDVIRFLVKHTQCNQGAIFIARGEGEDAHLAPVACYAYERKKFGLESIKAGSGLIGQCYLEQESIILYDVPQNFVRITSGLGEATPRFVALIPIKTTEGICGVIEVASFRRLSKHEVDFLEKAAGIFGAVVHGADTAKNIEALLQESQQRAEELRAQEEEMRQQMEELHATQEQMTRQLEENLKLKNSLQRRENVLNLTTIISEGDLHGTITFVNEKFCEVSQYREDELVGKGHNVLRHPDMPKEVFKQMWLTIKAGKVFRGIIKNRKKDGTHYWVDATIVPVTENGRIIKYIGARYHIQDDAMAQRLFDEQMKRMNLLIGALHN